MINQRSRRAVRWVAARPADTEIDHYSRPHTGFAPQVEIIFRRKRSVVERICCAGKPRGKGWKPDPANDEPNGDYFAYVHVRRVWP